MFDAKTQTKEMYKEIERIAERYSKRKDMGFIMFNRKAGVSLDVDSRCPKKEDPNQKPCSYCYVEQYKNRSFMRLAETQYCDAIWNDEVKNNLIEFCKEIKETGIPFIRLFSRSDYKRRHKNFWVNVIKTIQDNGIPCSIITKQKTAFADLGKIIHTFQYSVDLEDNQEFKYARSIKRKSDNVKIRAVMTDPSQLKYFEKRGVDIVTLLHNDASGKLRENIKARWPETTKKDWRPEKFVNKTHMIVCCAQKGNASHAKCAVCMGCVIRK